MTRSYMSRAAICAARNSIEQRNALWSLREAELRMDKRKLTEEANQLSARCNHPAHETVDLGYGSSVTVCPDCGLREGTCVDLILYDLARAEESDKSHA